MLTGFDDLPEIGVPFAREWLFRAQRRRDDAVRMAELLTQFHGIRYLRDFRPATVVEFGLRHGLSASESREFANVAKAVEEDPGVAEDVKAGETSVESAGILGWALKKEGLVEAMAAAVTPAPANGATTGPGSNPEQSPEKEAEVTKEARQEAISVLREEAKTLPAHEFRELIDKRIEELRHEERVRPLTLQLTDAYHDKFERARELVSKREHEFVTRHRAFEVVVDEYLRRNDRTRVGSRPRRMPDTRTTKTRAVPAEVEREVLARKNGRCMFPGCPNKTWLELAHRRPFRHGGSQEKDNLDGLCSEHHKRVDRSEFEIRGSTEAPVFYDSRGRRIAPNGRPIDPSGAGPP